jgi:uncharacterized membrane protein
MSSLVVISFDSPDEAAAVLAKLREQAKYGNISFEDTAVVSKELDGKVHVKNDVADSTMTSTAVGALLGLLLGMFMFPVAGILLGAGGGALIARMRNLGVDGEFVKEVANALQPGTSALFVVVHEANPDIVRAVLEDHPGKLLHTTLSSEAEENLIKALE